MQDLSSNELSYLPNSMGEMISLKDLNLRRNRLEVLPDGKDNTCCSLMYLKRGEYIRQRKPGDQSSAKGLGLFIRSSLI